MPPLSHNDLHKWYENLKKTLYETVNIDLNRKEDVGRVRIIRINTWHPDQPEELPNVDMIYPFISHRPLNKNETSSDPMLSYYYYDPAPPETENTEEYGQWLMEHFRIPPTDQQIQELYDMSAEGQLVVYDSDAEPDVHQVQNLNGTIKVTDKFNNCCALNLFPQVPEKVNMPEESGPIYKAKPHEPEDPGPEPKGILVKLGNLLGQLLGRFISIETRYSVYKRKKEAYDTYLRELSAWEDDCNERLEKWNNDVPNRREKMQQELDAYNKYTQDISNYFMNPLTRFSLAWGAYGWQIKVLDDSDEYEDGYFVERKVNEENFWYNQHQNTLQGNLQYGIDAITEELRDIKTVKKYLKQMFAPKYENDMDRIIDEIFTRHAVDAYQIPESDNIPKIDDTQAALICFAALADVTVLGTNIADESIMKMDAQERYQAVLDAFLLKNIAGSDKFFPFVTEARNAGSRAMQDYAQGKPEMLALMIGNCIRRQNRMISDPFGPYAAKSFGITASLLDLLEQHPALMKNCTLTQEELAQAQANAAICQMNKEGMTAKADLLGYAIYRNTLSEDERRNAVTNLLFMNTIHQQLQQGQNVTNIMSDKNAIEQAKNLLRQEKAMNDLIRIERTELGKAALNPELLKSKITLLNSDPKSLHPAKNPEQPQVSQQAMSAAPKGI